jgi:hypothetical protein
MKVNTEQENNRCFFFPEIRANDRNPLCGQNVVAWVGVSGVGWGEWRKVNGVASRNMASRHTA